MVPCGRGGAIRGTPGLCVGVQGVGGSVGKYDATGGIPGPCMGGAGRGGGI